MTHRGRVPVFLCIFLLSFPALAQTSDERITKLEEKLDELLRQAASIKQEIQDLRGTAAPVEDLTAIEVPAATEPLAAASQEPQGAATAITDVQTVENPSTAGAAKALNPDLSAIGTFVGHAGDNQLEQRDPIGLDEVELALEAFIDPYAKGKFFIAITPEEVDVEEGYAQFVTLPWGLTAKAGKTKATFGKVNTWHTHTRPWVDQPLMVTHFFGPEGLADVGVSVSKDIGNPWGAFIEATGEVYSGNAGTAFARASDNDLFYNAHVKFFRDITENNNIEVGTSFARGTLPDTTGSNRLSGLDVTYRWKPLNRSIYNSFIGRLEAVANRRADFDRTLYGYYASADYQIGRRWFAGVRLDSADALLDSERFTDRSLSALITFWPSEFSQIRGQYRRTKLGVGPELNELLIQLQFAIGAHGAHTF